MNQHQRDTYTREQLIEFIDNLEAELGEAEEKARDLQQEIEDIRLAPIQRNSLASASDLMADLGLIHNTPYAKWEWQSGR